MYDFRISLRTWATEVCKRQGWDKSAIEREQVIVETPLQSKDEAATDAKSMPNDDDWWCWSAAQDVYEEGTFKKAYSAIKTNFGLALNHARSVKSDRRGVLEMFTTLLLLWELRHCIVRYQYIFGLPLHHVCIYLPGRIYSFENLCCFMIILRFSEFGRLLSSENSCPAF